MITTWSNYLPKPVSRYLEFYLDFDGHKCSISQSYGPGDLMTQWPAASKDASCIMLIDTQTNEIMIRLDALIHYTKIEPQVIEDSNDYTSMQQLWYPKIEFSRGC
ncbi:hypothetical protein CPC16_011746 [Podila verticillata]|nr:hypothetical protein CPC16_011746 [Podila verticillata]